MGLGGRYLGGKERKKKRRLLPFPPPCPVPPPLRLRRATVTESVLFGGRFSGPHGRWTTAHDHLGSGKTMSSPSPSLLPAQLTPASVTEESSAEERI